MKEKFKSKEFFVKNRDNLKMLQQSLELEEIDKDIIPILEKFFYCQLLRAKAAMGMRKN